MTDSDIRPEPGPGLLDAPRTRVALALGSGGARGYAHKMKVVSLVERDGKKRSFQVRRVTEKTLRPIMKANIDAKTKLMTDDAALYRETSAAVAA